MHERMQAAGVVPDVGRRATATDHVALLTPVAKSWFTELGHRSADEEPRRRNGTERRPSRDRD